MEEQHKTARNVGLIGCLVILVAAAGYFARANEEKANLPSEIEKAVQEQRSKDSLESYKYKELADSFKIENAEVKAENKVLHKSNELILNAKTFIRNEIKRQTVNIDRVSDSTLFIIVDSILRAEYE